MNKERKWIGFKDVIVIALLTALSIVIQLATAMPFAASPQLMMFVSVAILMVISGPVYMLMMSKAPRMGAAFLYAAIQGIYYIILGQWMIGVVFLVGGIISECVLLGGGYQKPLRIGMGYLVYAAFYPLATYLPYLVLAEQYRTMLSSAGMAQVAVDSLMSFYASPVMILLSIICACVCAALGGFLGYKMLKKHFKPAGVV